MDYELLKQVAEADERPVGEVLKESGMTYTAFYKILKVKSIKVPLLENFCRVTGTHISKFFPEWENKRGGDVIPKADESIENYESSKTNDLKLLIQLKDELIAEQKERIKELTDLVSMFKSGKIKFTE